MTPAELDAANREKALELANLAINKALPGHVPGLDYGALRTGIADLVRAAIQEGLAEGRESERKRCLAIVNTIGMEEQPSREVIRAELAVLIHEGSPCDS